MKRIFLLTAVLFFMSCFSSLISSASDEGKVKKSLAPLNPAFLKYLKDKKEVKASSANGSVTGNVPVPLDLSHTKGRTPFTTPVSFPATYDLRDYNRVTSVKDQAGCGACWAFTAYGSLESCLMPGEETNFSEQDMIVNHGFDYSPCAGGHHFVSTAYLARWAGPLKESDFPYQYSNVSSGNEALVQKHIQETIFIPERSHYLDNDNIKHIIQTRGAVGMGFHVNQNSAYYNSTSAGYYSDEPELLNHGVILVGWDDNYSASNFSLTPPGNGAYLARNSWDTTFGNDGYFYISYYDVNMRQYFCNNAAEEVTNYGTNYQYDPLGMTNSLGYVDSVAWGANVFHARNNQPLKAVSFFIADVNTAYQVYVYKGVTPNNPTSGTLMATKTGSIDYPGYYTVPLNSMVPLSLDEAFSVVVRFETSAISYPVPVEYAIDAYSSAATSNAGESYISNNGTNWEDLYSADQQINVCIKAFSAYEGAAVGLHVEKETIRTWMVSKDIAKLSLHVTSNDTVNVSKIQIYRQVGTNSIELWKEVSMTEIQNCSYSCVDLYLAESAYVYKAVAVDSSGNPCGWSDVCTINE